jgi:hypothetical protein
MRLKCDLEGDQVGALHGPGSETHADLLASLCYL